MNKQLIRRIAACIPALVLVLFCLAGLGASADDTGGGTLHLFCEQEGVVLDGMDWQIYRVGSRVDNSFRLEGDFKDYPVTLGDPKIPMDQWDVDELGAAAQTLRTYAVLDEIPCLAAGTTNQNGAVDFKGLADGLYLVSGTRLVKGAYTYVPSPLFFEMRGDEVSELNAFPKIVYLTLNEDDAQYTVEKVWANDEHQPWLRTTFITVELYRDGKLSGTVDLNEENGWRYAWSDESGHEWLVKEKVIPPHYTVSVLGTVTQYKIVNTYSDTFDDSSEDHQTTTAPVTTDDIAQDSQTTTVTTAVTDGTTGSTPEGSGTTTMTTTTTTTTTTEDTLPQTGQLWWPILPLAGGGILLLTLGILSGRKDDSP